ncbi:MAG: nucleotide-binding universal stress UspA family protein [Patescibacteria group bacterium]|jgi:nucleotide-binding universal stress UspA family protein
MKKIFVPIDFSKCANSAAEVGLQIAQKTGASIIFMHLLTTPVDWGEIDVSKEKKYPEIRKKSRTCQSRTKQIEKACG